MDDNGIIRLIELRDEKAIEELTSAYGGYIRSVAYNILRNREDALECENDVYLEMWNNTTFEEGRSLRAYLGAVARNKALNMKRSRKQEEDASSDVSLDDIAELIPDTKPDGDILTEYELTELLNAFLAELSEDARIIFVRRYWNCEKIDEIAKRYGFSEGKVKMALRRTKTKFEKYLNRKENYYGQEKTIAECHNRY